MVDFPEINPSGFVALDFETANNELTSACSIGLAVFNHSGHEATHHFLIKPEPFYFNYHNIRVHGITPAMVAAAPAFGTLWPTLKPLIGDRILVAHNAQFDMRHLHQLFRMYGITVPTLPFVCTVGLSRKVYGKRKRYGLAEICDRMEIPLMSHHHAGHDAEACGRVALRLLEDTATPDLQTLLQVLKMGFGRVDEVTYQGFGAKYYQARP